MTTHTLNSNHTVAVATDVFWQPMSTCPLHVKVLLLGIGDVATLGTYEGKNKFWRGWSPMPKKPDWMKT